MQFICVLRDSATSGDSLLILLPWLCWDPDKLFTEPVRDKEARESGLDEGSLELDVCDCDFEFVADALFDVVGLLVELRFEFEYVDLVDEAWVFESVDEGFDEFIADVCVFGSFDTNVVFGHESVDFADDWAFEFVDACFDESPGSIDTDDIFEYEFVDFVDDWVFESVRVDFDESFGSIDTDDIFEYELVDDCVFDSVDAGFVPVAEDDGAWVFEFFDDDTGDFGLVEVAEGVCIFGFVDIDDDLELAEADGICGFELLVGIWAFEFVDSDVLEFIDSDFVWFFIVDEVDAERFFDTVASAWGFELDKELVLCASFESLVDVLVFLGLSTFFCDKLNCLALYSIASFSSLIRWASEESHFNANIYINICAFS